MHPEFSWSFLIGRSPRWAQYFKSTQQWTSRFQVNLVAIIVSSWEFLFGDDDTSHRRMWNSSDNYLREKITTIHPIWRNLWLRRNYVFSTAHRWAMRVEAKEKQQKLLTVSRDNYKLWFSRESFIDRKGRAELMRNVVFNEMGWEEMKRGFWECWCQSIKLNTDLESSSWARRCYRCCLNKHVVEKKEK